MENLLELSGDYQLQRREAEIKVGKERQVVGKRVVFCLLKGGNIIWVWWDKRPTPAEITQKINYPG